jgi:hypothetical protein
MGTRRPERNECEPVLSKPWNKVPSCEPTTRCRPAVLSKTSTVFCLGVGPRSGGTSCGTTAESSGCGSLNLCGTNWAAARRSPSSPKPHRLPTGNWNSPPADRSSPSNQHGTNCCARARPTGPGGTRRTGLSADQRPRTDAASVRRLYCRGRPRDAGRLARWRTNRLIRSTGLVPGDEAQPTLQLVHHFTTIEGKPVEPELLLDSLHVDQLTPFRRPPRLPPPEMASWVSAGRQQLAEITEGQAIEPLLVTVVWCKYLRCKLTFEIGDAQAELPFSSWAQWLTDGGVSPPPFVCPTRAASRFTSSVRTTE